MEFFRKNCSNKTTWKTAVAVNLTLNFAPKTSLTVALKKMVLSYVFQAAFQMDGWKFGDFQPTFPSLEVLKFWFI